MNYLLKSKPKNTNRSKFIIVISLYILLSIVGFLFGSGFRRVVWSIARPVWATKTFVGTPFVSIKNYFLFKNDLIAKNLSLEEQNATLLLKETDYDLVVKENDNLKNELGRTTNIRKTVAAVLSKPPRSPYDTMIIDVGKEDGVDIGSKVYAGGNIIIGLISNVAPNTSVVTLFSSNGQKIDSSISRTGETFSLLGSGGQNFKVQVPTDTDILWGDEFIYPSINSSILGNVYYIDTDTEASFKTIYIRIPTNVFALSYVYVE
jgi:cell shape-determining protein MreC